MMVINSDSARDSGSCFLFLFFMFPTWFRPVGRVSFISRESSNLLFPVAVQGLQRFMVLGFRSWEGLLSLCWV